MFPDIAWSPWLQLTILILVWSCCFCFQSFLLVHLQAPLIDACVAKIIVELKQEGDNDPSLKRAFECTNITRVQSTHRICLANNSGTIAVS